MWWRRGSKSNEKVKRFACSLRTAGSVTVSDCFVTLDMDLLSVCNGLRVKAAPRSPRPTVRKSATRTVCPTRSVTPTPNTCPAPWRQSTGQKPCWHTHTHTQRLLSRWLLYFPRLLKAMGWQEYPENDDNFLPLTEDELREFQTKTEQVGL